MYKIRTNDQALVITGGPEIAVAETINVQDCQFIFDKTWANLTVYACFKNQNIIDEAQILLDDTYTCKVPASVTMEPGNLYVGLLGVANGNIVKPTVWQRLAIVIQGVSPSGQIIDSNPTAIAQLTQIAEESLESATEALDRVSVVETSIENKIDKSSIVQEIGDSEELIMSQSAVTSSFCRQLSQMPNPTLYIGQTVQYVGNTRPYYTKGFHYTAVSSMENYWEQVEKEFYDMPSLSNDPNHYLNKIVHFIGPSDDVNIFDHWYKNIRGTWEEYNGQ